ncbi:3-mercaptopyruvate sulfurtransferase [Protomyces lactucae-debilis]|uniref:3-mercaptopyruvate sulfurtransferase n=1 Tax=Protomyces lactucae-debilis TaxID=2754530 RepID=A0A1Y2F0T6_PROLT|nr:3-mercaptopyruvate sulfurtransferase [Protomyces lactucae-debilis]ORY76956.1 3-mercaptopyruvate sulfurtransferase [Protomyces lactucae-debilis]
MSRSLFLKPGGIGKHIPIDGSWFMPNVQRSGLQEYRHKRIPNARFFDLDTICDKESPFPHMLPSAMVFSREMGKLGLTRNDALVIYDTHGLFSAPRVYWTLQVFGHKGDVKMLEGGLPAYEAAGLPLEEGEPAFQGRSYGDAVYHAERVLGFEDLIQGIKAKDVEIVDARPAARFTGEAPEPRAGLSSGHMPGAKSLPFNKLIRDGALLPAEELRQALAQADVDLRKRVVLTCGTGVTACVLQAALESLGVEDAVVYDESWTGYADERRAGRLAGMVVKDWRE